jgi:hypothetical protein
LIIKAIKATCFAGGFARLDCLADQALALAARRGLLGGVKAGEAPRLRVALRPFSKPFQNRRALCLASIICTKARQDLFFANPGYNVSSYQKPV